MPQLLISAKQTNLKHTKILRIIVKVGIAQQNACKIKLFLESLIFECNF